MLSTCRSLITGVSAARYNHLAKRAVRGMTSTATERIHLHPPSTSSKTNEMKDEYGDMDCSGETFVAKNFVLESGEVLLEAHVREEFFVFTTGAKIITPDAWNISQDIYQNHRFRPLLRNRQRYPVADSLLYAVNHLKIWSRRFIFPARIEVQMKWWFHRFAVIDACNQLNVSTIWSHWNRRATILTANWMRRRITCWWFATRSLGIRNSISGGAPC